MAATTNANDARVLEPRQKIRRIMQLVFLMTFPATFYYFSPVLSIQGASEGLVSGSLLLFVLLSISAFVTGRLFCSWVCPGGVIGDLAARGRTVRVKRDRIHWIKYLVWAPWMTVIIAMFVRSGGIHGVEPGYQTLYGFSVTSLPSLVTYLLVVALFLILSLAVGRRAACHTVCWMAPFMVVSRALRRSLRLPGLALATEPRRCTACGTCNARCPMSLPVQTLAARGAVNHYDCILCGECVDNCPTRVFRYRFTRAPLGSRS